MQHVASLSGVGWLRTRDTGSAIANYRIEIYRHTAGPEAGLLIGQGALATDGWALAVVRIERGSTLVLGSGERVEIRLLARGASDSTATFTITGEMPIH